MPLCAVHLSKQPLMAQPRPSLILGTEERDEANHVPFSRNSVLWEVKTINTQMTTQCEQCCDGWKLGALVDRESL